MLSRQFGVIQHSSVGHCVQLQQSDVLKLRQVDVCKRVSVCCKRTSNILTRVVFRLFPALSLPLCCSWSVHQPSGPVLPLCPSRGPPAVSSPRLPLLQQRADNQCRGKDAENNDDDDDAHIVCAEGYWIVNVSVVDGGRGRAWLSVYCAGGYAIGTAVFGKAGNKHT